MVRIVSMHNMTGTACYACQPPRQWLPWQWLVPFLFAASCSNVRAECCVDNNGHTVPIGPPADSAPQTRGTPTNGLIKRDKVSKRALFAAVPGNSYFGSLSRVCPLLYRGILSISK